jgi:hypothetical protein
MSKINYHIYIPTRGRTANQLTVERLPKGMHGHVTLVCPKDEVVILKANYPKVNVLAQPKSIQTLSAKRQWIMENSPHKYAFMFDDDLYLYAFDKEQDKHVVASTVPEVTKGFWTKVLPDLCSRYKCVGLGTKAFAPKGGIKENSHLGFAFGMSKATVKKIVWDRLFPYEDIDYTLQLLKGGTRIALTYDMAVAQRKADAPGGLEGERTRDMAKAALQKLLKLHPDVVKEKPPSAQHPDSNTRISWRGAAKIGGLI